MHYATSNWRRIALLSCALASAVVSVNAQGRGVQVADLIRQTRTAIGHGDIPSARQIAETGKADQPTRDLAAALVDIAEGKFESARVKLTPLAVQTPLGEAALELGLVEIRMGRRAEGRRRLDPLASNRALSSPDDFFRLARAARGNGEFLLANDAHQRADVDRADIQTAWGDLFLERHLPGDAVISYRKALEVDARWVPAMLGLARALAEDAPPESRKALEAARAQAPDFPDVSVATAEQKLEAEDVAAAKAALDHLAKVKPNSIEELGLRAAIAYKESGLDAVDAVAASVKAINPTSGLAYRLASEQAARDYRFDDSAALAKKATDIDPEDAAAFFDLGLALMRTGDEPAARTALDISWEIDKSAPLTKNLLEVLDNLDKFDVVSHGDFIFKFDKAESAIMKVYALPLVDDAYKQFKERYALTPKGPILIEIFPRHNDFAVRTVGLQGLGGALGACFGRVITMDSPRARPPGDFSWQATLWHELGHVFSLQASDYRVPRWLTEGISVYEEHRKQSAWGRELTLEFAHLLSKGETFGVKKLPDAFKKPETLAMAYFEAALVVEHLVALNGEAGLRALLKAYADRAKDADAFAKAFGKSVDEVDASFAAFIEQRYGALKNAMRDPPTQVAADDLAGLRARAEANPGNFLSQTSFARALIRTGDLDGARVPLERAAALAPTALGNDSPRALLAGIAEKANDPAKARQWLRELLRYDHSNVVAARKLRTLAAAAKATEEEDAALVVIRDTDPFDAQAHSQLGGRLMAKGDPAGALLEFQATLALGPTNPAEAHADAGEALLKLGRREEARAQAMLALKQAPTFDRAQDLLLAASGK